MRPPFMDVAVVILGYQLGGPEIGPKFPTASLKQGLQVEGAPMV